MEYTPFERRDPDEQYRTVLARIVDEGEKVPTKQGPPALTLMQQVMRFELGNGFPMITERSVRSFWRKPIGELCAFINGATTLDEFEEFGCDWWGDWATPAKTSSRGLPPGNIGPGSYGGAFHDFPTLESGPFDQFAHLVEQIRELPDVRTHFVSPWIPQYQVRGAGKRPRTTIAPCHGWVHVRVLNGRLHLHMFQRSGDVPVGVPSNMIQYAALTLMLEHLTGVPAGVYYHTISDAHVYDDQLDQVKTIIGRESRRLPTVLLNDAGRAVTDIHDFRAEHFDLADYEPHGGLRIPVSP
ncbi:thymidylate synthase [Actinokineospora spheciospongiae]|uniref:thymidylate synthase n=1 Tax=Actinokineospora spheciospongiae TaxID=909613 RepID=UPI000D713A2D|nr:thymidylate synthase [Actinokineospora spheciospongiae]PWW62792.1 thymidylate synthase [Actinokineospora spheciospongiae]